LCICVELQSVLPCSVDEREWDESEYELECIKLSKAFSWCSTGAWQTFWRRVVNHKLWVDAEQSSQTVYLIIFHLTSVHSARSFKQTNLLLGTTSRLSVGLLQCHYVIANANLCMLIIVVVIIVFGSSPLHVSAVYCTMSFPFLKFEIFFTQIDKST